jgi:hypothetical protein
MSARCEIQGPKKEATHARHNHFKCRNVDRVEFEAQALGCSRALD